MLFILSLALLYSFLGLAAGSPARPTNVVRSPSLTERDDAASTTICGDIIDYVNDGNFYFYASDAYACLASVPFNPAVALRFIDYYNTTILFQSTLAYLKAPPEGYQQPAIDVLQELEEIKHNVTSGVYPNQYAFEAALQSVVYRMHDAHVQLYAGVLAPFVFISPVDLVTASKDGKEEPQVYFTEDVHDLRAGATDISPIKSINGEDVVTFLSRLAALQSVGMLEPHADWNGLMSNPARDVQGGLSTLSGGMTFYPGDELNFTFVNGSEHNTYWFAIYTEPYYTGPLTTGGDFYNYFVLGLLPASYEGMKLPPAFTYTGFESGIVNPDTAITDYNYSDAYPDNPDIVQHAITNLSLGFLTGYYLNDVKTGVVSIPSFDQVAWDIGNFSAGVKSFIEGAHAAKLEKVIIDLQGNSGGLVELAFVTFRQFFPGQVPFAGSRRRSHELANALGMAYNDYWKQLPSGHDDKFSLQANEWVVLQRINAATGHNFTSWAQYYGPRNFHDDQFSLIERYDLQNEQFDAANFEGWIPTAYTEGGDGEAPEWNAKNIVILTDGVCSSTCALFVEMMAQVGVKSVVVGGRPVEGPMQATSGSRGAAPYMATDLDVDFENARAWSREAEVVLPQNRDPNIFVNFATFNLRDQVRQDDKTGTPLQFQYLPADCRLYFTLENVFNMSALWRDVGYAAWVDDSRCVSGSMPSSSSTSPPSNNEDAVRPDLGLYGDAPGGEGYPDALLDKKSLPVRGHAVKLCNPKHGSSDCGDHVPCQPMDISCPGGVVVSRNLCVVQCNNPTGASNGGNCPDPLTQRCHLDDARETRDSTAGITSGRIPKTMRNKVRSGHCVPYKGTEKLCKTSTGTKETESSPSPSATIKNS